MTRAVNPRLFGSTARGDAHDDSDIDILVDLIADEEGSASADSPSGPAASSRAPSTWSHPPCCAQPSPQPRHATPFRCEPVRTRARPRHLGNIAIIGEAANHLPKEILDAHPELDWPVIIGMRNEYHRVDPVIITRVLDYRLAPLVIALSGDLTG